MKSRGDTLEEELYSCLKRMIETGLLGFAPDTVCVFRKKKYHSAHRGGPVEIDVSIEFTLPGTLSPALLWLWECKNHSRTISVGIVEQFDAVLQELGANRTKGTIVTYGGYSHAAVRYAQSRGIGLARIVRRKRLEFGFPATLGNPSRSELAMDTLTRENREGSTHSNAAGVDSNGRFLLSDRFEDGVAATISDQLQSVAFAEPGGAHHCSICGASAASLAADARFHSYVLKSVGGQEQRVVMPFWRTFSLCATCTRLALHLRSTDDTNAAFRLLPLLAVGESMAILMAILLPKRDQVPPVLSAIAIAMLGLYLAGRSILVNMRCRSLRTRAMPGVRLPAKTILSGDLALALLPVADTEFAKHSAHHHTRFRLRSEPPACTVDDGINSPRQLRRALHQF